jgi:hypothetical protein
VAHGLVAGGEKLSGSGNLLGAKVNDKPPGTGDGCANVMHSLLRDCSSALERTQGNIGYPESLSDRPRKTVLSMSPTWQKN